MLPSGPHGYAGLIDRPQIFVAAPHCKLSPPPPATASLLQERLQPYCVDTPSTEAAAAADSGSCDGGGRPAPTAVQLHGQRWRGWSCEHQHTTHCDTLCCVCSGGVHNTTFPQVNCSDLIGLRAGAKGSFLLIRHLSSFLASLSFLRALQLT